MKSLHKKLGVIVLSGLALIGGSALGKSAVFANSISYSKSAISVKQEAEANLHYLVKEANRSNEFRILDFDFLDRINRDSIKELNLRKGKNYDFYPMFFNSPQHFFKEIDGGKRYIYGMRSGIRYSGQIGGLIFEFELFKDY